MALSSGDLHAAVEAGLDKASCALLELVHKITFEAFRIAVGDIESVRKHGFTDNQIAEAIYVAALFAFFNRIADAFGIPSTNRLVAALSQPLK